MPDDLNFQKMSSVQSGLGAKPVTLASAATVAPTTFLTLITGTVQLATITPPVSGAHLLALLFTNASPGVLLTSGNIGLAATPVQNRVLLLAYDPNTAKYWPAA